MLKSIIVSSIAISSAFASRAHFSYPEDTSTDSWAADTVLPASETNYCGKTHVFQSPIDIQNQTAINNGCPTTKPLNWKLTSSIHHFHVENTGHNLKIVPVLPDVIDNEDSNDGESNDHDDSNENPEFENLQNLNKFGELIDIFGTMEKYCLDSFHIHWGQDDNTGSEHTVDGKASVMEMHFVHRACRYNTITEAIGIQIDHDKEADAPPTLAVVSVMFNIGAKNVLIQKIVDQVDKLKVAHSHIDFEDDNVDMLDVAPINGGQVMGHYFHYKGSLTTPPCTPVVSWHVLEKPLTVSAEQLKVLRDNIMNEEKTPGKSAPNFRGTKTNGHSVYRCSAAGTGGDDEDD